MFKRPIAGRHAHRSHGFQSLSRDSGCSSHLAIPGPTRGVFSFNPSVGILGVQAHDKMIKALLQSHVSIPQSGFWVFKPFPVPLPQRRPSRFNPSVGILGVQAATMRVHRASPNTFQSLSRDSGCSSQRTGSGRRRRNTVSIPQSGFWVFKQFALGNRTRQCTCFNPSVGILGVQARRPLACHHHLRQVSIPQSGFWVFKPGRTPGGERKTAVSIPQSGFWVFKPQSILNRKRGIGKFQSLSRDSGCSS